MRGSETPWCLVRRPFVSALRPEASWVDGHGRCRATEDVQRRRFLSADIRITINECAVPSFEFKHGYDEPTILHAIEHAIVVVDLEPGADPPKVLAIGPDPAGNLLEVIWLELAEVELVIHAMPLRPVFHNLLPTGEDLTS